MSGKKYLVRLMSFGEELWRVETDNIREAREAYRAMGPPGRHSAPSLRVNSKALTWDKELMLMQCSQSYGETEANNPEKVKHPPCFVSVRLRKNGKDIYLSISRYALGLLEDPDRVRIQRVRIQVDSSAKAVRLIPAEDGLKVSNKGVGKGAVVCANNALRGIHIPYGVRFPVEPCDGGIMFRF